MSALDLFKLEKLMIFAYKHADRAETERLSVFEAMFNPESIKQQYGIRTAPNQANGSTNQRSTYIRSEPSELKLELLLDGSGVTDNIVLPPGPAVKSVTQRVKEFLDTAFKFVSDTHEPPYLTVQWGDLWDERGFNCRLINADVTYTRFDRSGRPLRAKLDITLKSDQTWENQLRSNNPQSPDLTQQHTVIAGDSLPLLARKFYGSAEHALFVARHNDLDDIRFLQPGSNLTFPPLPGRGKQTSGTQ